MDVGLHKQMTQLQFLFIWPTFWSRKRQPYVQYSTSQLRARTKFSNGISHMQNNAAFPETQLFVWLLLFSSIDEYNEIMATCVNFHQSRNVLLIVILHMYK